MKKQAVAAIVATLVAGSAFAGGNANNNGPKYTTTGTTVVNNTTSNATKNTNRNSVSLANRDTNAQRQSQAQNQTQAQVNRFNVSPTTNSQGGTSSISSAENNNASQAVNFNTPRHVSSAANVTIMPTSVCAGSTAAGAQGASFGLSFGSSWTDQNCMLLEQARTVAVILDQPEVAAEMLCSVDAYREARIRLGNPCKQGPAAKAAKQAETPRRLKDDEYTDEIVRFHLGLPPLKQ